MGTSQIATLKFPKNFYWGASTAAHQVEGNNHNHWAQWEKQNAAELAKTFKKRYAQQAKYAFGQPPWEKFSHQAQNLANYISGQATRHYSLYKKDFQLAKKFHHNAHRFSIEWSRIQPEPDQFDYRELKHYQAVIDQLRKLEIEPFVTLWHFTNPVWFQEQGGWTNPNAPRLFANYVRQVVRSLDRITFWLTINEPMVYAAATYLGGFFPFGQKNALFKYFRSIRNFIRAHQLAYTTIKDLKPTAQVSLAKNNAFFEAYQDNPINKILKFGADKWWNEYFLNRVREQLDFIGLNHYAHNRINYGFNKNENQVISDMGWELYPEAIYHVLTDLRKYRLPIYITENGLADAEDEKRSWFICETLKYAHQALQEGVDLRGYLHWSLLDNFEWDKGFWPRFGLIEVNYDTFERIPRPSAYNYAQIIKENSLDT